MKILIATGLYPPEIGGPATYVQMLEDALPKRGHEVTVVPFGWVRHYPKLVRHFVYGYKLWQASKNQDVIYGLDAISVGIPALCVATLTKKPFLLRLGGDYAWEQGVYRFGLTETLDEYLRAESKRPLMVKVLALFQGFVTQRADSVIAPSEYLKSVFIKWGVAEHKIKVIYSAFTPVVVEPTKEDLRAQFNFNFPTLISAGRLMPWKGFKVLLHVTAKLKSKYPNIMLVIAGDGDELVSLKAETQALNIESSVRFVGRISKEALSASVKAADVFLLNTAYEGLSHQLIEVMDIGTPIVTTPAGGNTELITDTISGCLVPFNDEDAFVAAIERLLEYPETRTRIIQTARARSKDFAAPLMIDQLEQLLSQYARGT